MLGSAVTKSMVDVNLGVLGRKELDPDKAMDVGELSTPPLDTLVLIVPIMSFVVGISK